MCKDGHPTTQLRGAAACTRLQLLQHHPEPVLPGGAQQSGEPLVRRGGAGRGRFYNGISEVRPGVFR